MRLKEIEKRLNAIRAELETRGAELTEEELEARETEVKKFHDKGNSVIKGKENNNAITAKEAFCSDRNIPIQ